MAQGKFVSRIKVQQKSVSKLDLGLALHFSTHFPFFAANQN
jgi:hypothetical protein